MIRAKTLGALLIHCTWALPQTVIGFFVLAIVRIGDRQATTTIGEAATVRTWTTLLGGGVSLGMFLFSLDYRRVYGRPCPRAQARMDAHEWGHAVQSCMLGPLYLPVVGVPSVARAIVLRAGRRRGGTRGSAWYYGGFPEAWADRLGGVTRDRAGYPVPPGRRHPLDK